MSAQQQQSAFGQVKYYKDPGTMQPIYEFPIESAGQDPIMIDSDGHDTLDVLQTYLKHDDSTGKLMTALIAANKAMFAKPYTAAQLLKLTTHAIRNYEENTGTIWRCTPVKITLAASKFVVFWDLEAVEDETPMIDLGDILLSRPASPAASATPAATHKESELVDVTNTLHVSADAPTFAGQDTDSLRSADDIKRSRERDRLYEAHLRAKLAIFQAERARQKYIDRYGEEGLTSDSESEDDEDSYAEFT
jgi:hypothetical protein